jgi:hypothetical protein
MRALRNLTFLVVVLSVRAGAEGTDFPTRLFPSEIAGLSADREMVYGPRQALMLTAPDGVKHNSAVDPITRIPFYGACHVYLNDTGVYTRQFIIHVESRQHLPLAHRAGRFLSLLWGMAERRFGRLRARLREGVVEVWLVRSGEPGGELEQNNLYVYNVLTDRKGIEWARELAHEYGHYLLPGASGYTEPENWSNGVLGERLFLRWLRDDVKTERIDPSEVPFVKIDDLRDYCAKQVTPLIEQVRTAGVDESIVRGTNRRAMDAFTGLILYADATYGGDSTVRMLDFLPRPHTGRAGGMEFLNAFVRWTGSQSTFTMRVVPNKPTMVYLHSGSYRITQIAANPGGIRTAAKPAEPRTWTANIEATGWQAVKFPGDLPLRWERQQSAMKRSAGPVSAASPSPQ